MPDNIKSFNLISSVFNQLYSNVNSVDTMPSYSEFKPEMMHCQRTKPYMNLCTI